MILKRGYRAPTEEKEQKALVKWLTLKKITFYHIPNGGYRNAREGAKFKILGVKRGIPDLCIPLARKPYHGLYIELKRRVGGVVSLEQGKWIGLLTQLGYCVKVAYGWDEGVKIVEEYLKGVEW